MKTKMATIGTYSSRRSRAPTSFQWFHKQDIDHLKKEKRKNMGSHCIVNYEERI